jgi:polyisoprenoid-binding protein YceI
MSPTLGVRALLTATALVTFASASVIGQDVKSTLVEIHEGTAAFDASTNLPAIKIHGKSDAVEGRARIRQSTDGLVIERLEAILPVKSLKTGMTLRDEHMRKFVFTTADGQVPDVRFVSSHSSCSGATGSYSCKLVGDLFIRNTARPFSIVLKVADDGSTMRAAGSGVVRLSAYAIPPPSQLGVKTQDDVTLRMDFVVRRGDDRIAAEGR